MGVTQNPQGWTDVTPAADTKIAYVDATGGNDGTAVFYDWNDAAIGADPYNPVGPINAYQTIAAAKANIIAGSPDWMLLKRGEVWDETFEFWSRSGRTQQEPVLLSAYGSGARPVLYVQVNGEGMKVNDGFGNLYLIGIEFYGYYKDPVNPGYVDGSAATGISWLNTSNVSGLSDFTIEDCVFRMCGVSFKDQSGVPFDSFTIRRSMIVDNYAASGSHNSGSYIFGTDNLLLEENLWDHNGWYGDRDTGGGTDNGAATGFNHNVYIDNEFTTNNTIIRNNIFANASSHGIQLRSGGVIENNLFVQNPIPILLGGGDDPELTQPDGVDGLIRRNVILNANDINSNDDRGFGMDVENIRSVTISENVIAHYSSSPTGNARGIALIGNSLLPSRGIVMQNNTLYDHRRGAIQISSNSKPYVTIDAEEENEYWDAASLPWAITGTNRKSEDLTFVDAQRDVGGYDASIGGPGTTEAFLLEARKQARTNWRTQYLALAANAWISPGYVSDTVPSGPVAPSGLKVTVA